VKNMFKNMNEKRKCKNVKRNKKKTVEKSQHKQIKS